VATVKPKLFYSSYTREQRFRGQIFQWYNGAIFDTGQTDRKCEIQGGDLKSEVDVEVRVSQLAAKLQRLYVSGVRQHDGINAHTV